MVCGCGPGLMSILLPDLHPSSLTVKKHGKGRGSPGMSSPASSSEVPSPSHTHDMDDEQDADDELDDLGRWVPPLLCSGQTSEILSEELIHEMDSKLPDVYQGRAWRMLYSVANNGCSLKSFYARVNLKAPTVLLVKTADNEVFGAFTNCPWEVNVTSTGPEYYGIGESFLFKLEDDRSFTLYHNTLVNTYYMLGTHTSIGMGGGGGEFGLYLGEDFMYGTSGESETYRNKPLSRKRNFEVQAFECWTLENIIVPGGSSNRSNLKRTPSPPQALSNLHSRGISSVLSGGSWLG